MEKNKKINFILLGSVIILSILYIVSLFNNKAGGDKRKAIKTALVNSKYENTINNFLLQKADQQLYLVKQNEIWLAGNAPEQAALIPADTQKVNSFIKDLTKIINLYKISDNLPAKNDFGLTDENTFVISYDQNQIYFGNYDFSKTSRYLMTGKNTKVYETDTSLDKYLSTSIQAWSDPYIVSKALISLTAKDIQTVTGPVRKDCDLEKLLDLRHGGAAVTPIEGAPELCFTLITGDTSEVELTFYKTASESEFNVDVNYKLGLSGKKYSCSLKISLWTYNKIKNIML